MQPARPDRRTLALAALAGIAAGGLTLAVAEVVAAVLAPAASPVLAVGAAFIDLTPRPLKDFAIETFGTNDKVALLVSMAVVIAALAAVAGMLALRRPMVGRAVVVALGLVAMVAALTRPSAGAVSALPSLIGIGAGVVALDQLLKRLRGTAADGEAVGGSRRSFLAATGVVAAGAVVIGSGARLLGRSARSVTEARQSLRLPGASRGAPAMPAAADLDIEGITSYVTPNDTFYRIDTALSVPQIDPAQWRLRVHGMVEEEVELSFADVLDADLVEAWVTLTCVSNEVGGDLIGNAKWLGLPIRDVLERARPLQGADMVLSTSQDGFSASTPLDVLVDEQRDCLLAVGMNDEPLPVEHGFPVRMVVPGLYGYVSATKWVVDLEVTTFAERTAYWTDRGWDARGPIKTSSRVDVPRPFETVQAGAVTVAGVAWAQVRGIETVEVRLDGGPWQPAELADVVGADTWRQWSVQVEAGAGQHQVEVRATDTEGQGQNEVRVPPFPNGSEGWHSVSFTVA